MIILLHSFFDSPFSPPSNLFFLISLPHPSLFSLHVLLTLRYISDTTSSSREKRKRCSSPDCRICRCTPTRAPFLSFSLPLSFTHFSFLHLTHLISRVDPHHPRVRRTISMMTLLLLIQRMEKRMERVREMIHVMIIRVTAIVWKWSRCGKHELSITKTTYPERGPSVPQKQPCPTNLFYNTPVVCVNDQLENSPQKESNEMSLGY